MAIAVAVHSTSAPPLNIMPDDKPQYPVKVVLSNEQGQDSGEATINAPGVHDFSNIPVGKYQAKFTPLGEFNFIGENPKTYVADVCGCLMVTVSMEDISTTNEGKSSGEEKKKDSWVKPIFIPSIAVALMSILEPSFISCSGPSHQIVNQDKFPQRTVPQKTGKLSKSSNNNPVDSNQFGLGFSKSLETCILKNLETLMDIPGLSEVTLLLLEEDIEADPFASRIIYLYEKYNQVRAVLEDCDIASIDQLLEEANKLSKTSNVKLYVLVSGQDVNIRKDPLLDSNVISQASNGDKFLLNTVEFYALPDHVRASIISGDSWYPIFLSNGRKGYIYSKYGTLFRHTE